MLTSHTQSHAHPKHAQCAVLAGQDGANRPVLTKGEGKNVIDLIRAEEIVSVFAVDVVIVHVGAADKQTAAIHTPCIGGGGIK